MFFVAIGIIILFASFIIALISLIREQNEEEQDREKVPAVPDVPEGDNGLPAEASKVEEPEEPFPWEAASVDHEENIESTETVGGGGVIAETERGENLSGEISLRNLKRQ